MVTGSESAKGAPQQILSLCYNKDDLAEKVQLIINRFAERGLRSLAVAYQEVPEKSKHDHGEPWVLCGLLTLFDLLRHDSADTICRALDLGVCVKMITGITWPSRRRPAAVWGRAPTCTRWRRCSAATVTVAAATWCFRWTSSSRRRTGSLVCSRSTSTRS